ncbi:MAG: MFS transporter [Candidatus Levybacteria bacterium]|nr:MFS transporter [Candidatus Levybacteria bacterium]MBI3070357.1 MFS transporter [Candidatus Levybacteria bacterium]
MLKEQFLGRNPSHFQINPVVKAFIVSETFLWSAWNFVTPIFAIFVVSNIEGGNVQIAASAFSVYLIARVFSELLSGRYLLGKIERGKFILTIGGMLFLSLSYVGFAFSNTIFYLFFFYAMAGVGLGIASPAKNSLFSTHLDKNKEPSEWGIYDAITFTGMALATALGGFIANQYGFSFLFLLASIVNLLGIFPYLLYIREK